MKDDKKEADFVTCKYCTGNIDLLSGDYFQISEFSKGKLYNESFYHKLCWEGKYKQEVTKTAHGFVEEQLKGQMQMLQNIMIQPVQQIHGKQNTSFNPNSSHFRKGMVSEDK